MTKWLAFAAALIVATGAHAQTKKELVNKLIQLQQPAIEGIARAIAVQTSNQTLTAARQQLPRLPEDKREAVSKQLQGDVKAFYDEVEPLLRKRAVELAPGTLGPTFEERFTEDELKQLIAWFESPLARKYQQVGPELQSGMMQKLVADVRPSMEPKLKALQDTLRNRFVAAAGPAAAASPPAGGKK